MRQYAALVRLFWQQLIRRKSLWMVMAVAAFILLVYFAIQSQMKEMTEAGLRYDIATRRAAQALGLYVEYIRDGAAILVLVVAALVAPPARRDGTTQFVLTLSVSRLRLALAQFGALAIFIAMATSVIHVGYVATAYRLGAVSLSEALLAWPLLLVPLLVLGAASFSLSLTRPPVLVYAILLAVPYLLLPLLGQFVGILETDTPQALRLLAARAIDNLQLLFPTGMTTLAVWPRLALPTPERPPFPAWSLEAVQTISAAAFWVVAGLWSYRRHDFGSRTLTK